MTIVIACIVGVLLGLDLAVIVCGLRSAHRRPPRPGPPEGLRVTVLVPVKGDGPRLEHCLRGLAEQRASPYRLIIITESDTDGAAPAARALADEYAYVRHLVAGSTARSGQKNHNLLAGVAAAPDTDVFVTADADILPEPDWLSRLIAPLADPSVEIVTTHQRPAAPMRGIPALSCVVMLGYLHALSAFPGVYSLWGGSTAYRARLFEAGLADVWATNVVDDVSAAVWASGRGLGRVYLGESLVPAPAPAFDWAGLYRWFLRQTQFQKHCSPPGWIAMFATHVAGTLLAVYAPIGLALAAAGLTPWTVPLLSLAYVVGFASIVSLTSRIAPDGRRSMAAYALAAVGMTFVGATCLVASVFTSSILWSGRRYAVGRGGRVERIDQVGSTR